MRITNKQRDIIGKTAISHFGKDVKVYLFGSRTDLGQKGGDIDILIEGVSEEQNIIKKKIALIADLKIKLGDQKIDVVIKNRKTGESGFQKIIEKDMIRLC